MTPRGRRPAAPGWIFAALLLSSMPGAAGAEDPAGDLAAARRLFQANLDAIRDRDRDAYLACYLPSPELARTGPAGMELGFAALEQATGSAWPDRFEGLDLRLVPIRPGMVYGTYRYRVRYGEREESGLSERVFVKTAEGWRIAVSTAFPGLPGTPPPPRALVGGTLLDGRGPAPIPDSVVLLRSGKIECAGSRRECAVPAGVERVDLQGSFITPGLVDAHVHFSQSGWVDGRPDALDLRARHPYERAVARLKDHPEPLLRSYLCSGVTAVFDVGGYAWTWDLRARAESDPLAPHVAAAGPLLSTWDFWLNLPGERQFLYLADRASALQAVQYLAARKSDAVKIWFIVTGERDFDDVARQVLAAGEEARRLGVPLIVHATGLREAKVALRAGASMLVHGVGDLPVDKEFLELARAGKTTYCPTLTVLEGYRRLAESAGSGKAPDVDDPNGCVDPGTLRLVRETGEASLPRSDPARVARMRELSREEDRIGAANLKAVRDAGIPIAMGTDAGNPLTLHGPSVYAEMEAMQAAGMSPGEVLIAATREGARAMGRLDRWGTIEAGKEADLLVVDADPLRDIRNLRQVRYVVKGGVVRSLAELRATTSPAPGAAR